METFYIKTQIEKYPILAYLQVDLDKAYIFTLDLKETVCSLIKSYIYTEESFTTVSRYRIKKTKFDKILNNLLKKNNKIQGNLSEFSTSSNKVACRKNRNQVTTGTRNEKRSK